MFGRLAAFLNHALPGERLAALQAVHPTCLDLQYSWEMATGYALIDERDQGLEWLQRGVDLGFLNYPLLSEQDPLVENLRRDERFRPLMEEVRRRLVSHVGGEDPPRRFLRTGVKQW